LFREGPITADEDEDEDDTDNDDDDTEDDEKDDEDDEDDEEGAVLESNKTIGLRTAGWELPKTSWSEKQPLPSSRGT
jgi:hypothetical protein